MLKYLFSILKIHLRGLRRRPGVWGGETPQRAGGGDGDHLQVGADNM